ncbi:hypothetical protein BDV30DRAFT_66626 [Aspergillus minisclerotigenes]|uniref:Uncharacterized protein n=1 Tax=Aspergillus minisclerotigenes TaxID=656917 RepID=A0A5N6ILD9_9EURO|nr:hypothetical protein BDV30DRAFT_66626 [Aspergillus minisclerotigenes]
MFHIYFCSAIGAKGLPTCSHICFLSLVPPCLGSVGPCLTSSFSLLSPFSRCISQQGPPFTGSGPCGHGCSLHFMYLIGGAFPEFDLLWIIHLLWETY